MRPKRIKELIIRRATGKNTLIPADGLKEPFLSVRHVGLPLSLEIIKHMQVLDINKSRKTKYRARVLARELSK